MMACSTWIVVETKKVENRNRARQNSGAIKWVQWSLVTAKR